MKTIALNLALSTLLLSAAAATAQSDTMWDKSYPVTGQPSLDSQHGRQPSQHSSVRRL